MDKSRYANISVVGPASFPTPTGAVVNMMPIVMGDSDTLPVALRPYQPMIDACDLTPGDTVYLTVHESMVNKGATQRRAGVHTDGTSAGPWGGGSWGGSGIFMASTDGDCLAWDEHIPESEVDDHGALRVRPGTPGVRLEPNTLYRVTDRTPHEGIPASTQHYRQFFRLVGPDIFAWYSMHSTPSPFGVAPKCRVISTSKFASV